VPIQYGRGLVSSPRVSRDMGVRRHCNIRARAANTRAERGALGRADRISNNWLCGIKCIAGRSVRSLDYDPMSQREVILSQALQLAPQDRAYVADALEQSLESAGLATPDLSKAWAAEVERRLAAYDRGEMPASDAGPAMDRLRQILADLHARRVAS
jgi:putative addiction module component (TIGR02574 family)